MAEQANPTDNQDDPQNESDQQALITKVERHQLFLGPLPPPDVIRQYDEICPGAADRIIGMAERQAQHRQTIESKVINSDTVNSKMGMVFGFVIALISIIGGVYIILQDKIFPGIAIIMAMLVSLVGTFVYGSHQRRIERSKLPVNNETETVNQESPSDH